MENKQETGLRYNSNKLRWSLVDFQALEPMVRVLEFGSKKYSDDNWRKGLKVTEICESLLRHTFAFMNGEDADPESGELHVGHMLCNAKFLSYMVLFKPEYDNRRKREPKDVIPKVSLNNEELNEMLKTLEWWRKNTIPGRNLDIGKGLPLECILCKNGQIPCVCGYINTPDTHIQLFVTESKCVYCRNPISKCRCITCYKP